MLEYGIFRGPSLLGSTGYRGLRRAAEQAYLADEEKHEEELAQIAENSFVSGLLGGVSFVPCHGVTVDGYEVCPRFFSSSPFFILFLGRSLAAT